MIMVPKCDFRPLPYLVSLGVVGVATIAVFFGVGFLLLAPPHPTAPSADPGHPTQALEALDLSPPVNNDTAWGSTSAPAPAAERVVASPGIDAPSDREVPTFRFTAIETALVPPARITRAKTVRIGRHRHEKTGRRWVRLWRSNSSAGPNPGGGFYGPPNINVGYINPK
jgi:hypothetical protein